MDVNSLDHEKRFVFTLIMAGGGLLLMCMLCSAGWLITQGRAATSGVQTRTALVQMFETVPAGGAPVETTSPGSQPVQESLAPAPSTGSPATEAPETVAFPNQTSSYAHRGRSQLDETPRGRSRSFVISMTTMKRPDECRWYGCRG
jgi:hypothetical protein